MYTAELRKNHNDFFSRRSAKTGDGRKYLRQHGVPYVRRLDHPVITFRMKTSRYLRVRFRLGTVTVCAPETMNTISMIGYRL